ncbi:PQQ-binding-like beta-propeller repeat protein [Motilimonas sp. KMU-193]|uniref:PQQ-binding-like beta-propeller repeat protein n=1 Tax=Motilimonas sp. KMU-193 TaxID=3388668 RepID=UPI00396B4174
MRSLIKTSLIAALVAGSLGTSTLAQAASGDYLWSFKTQGQIWSSIKVNQQIAFFGSDDGYFYAMDTERTKLKWKFKTDGIVRSTPAFHHHKVYITSDDGFLYAINRWSGRLLWKQDLHDGDATRNLPANQAPWDFDYTKSSPVTNGNLVYVGSADQHFYAFNARTGELVWKFKTGGSIRSTADVEGNMVYISSWDGKTYGLNKHTGELIWSHTSGAPIVSDPLVIGDKVIIGSRDAHLYALDAATGAVSWDYMFQDWSWIESSAIEGENDDVFYIASSDSKRLIKFDADSGQEIWSFDTKGWSWGTPKLADGVVYIGATGADEYWTPVNRGFYAVDAQTGEQLWQYQPDASKQPYKDIVHGGVYGTVEVKHGKVFVPDLDGYMHVFEQ